MLSKSGHEEDAKKVLIAKNEDRIELGAKLSITQKLWYRIFGPMIGYGHRPLDVFWKGPMGVLVLGSILFWLVCGCVFFGLGAKNELITPTQGWAYKTDAAGGNKTLVEDYPAFNFVVYSIDSFVPLVDLHQSKYWLPNAKREIWDCSYKNKCIDLTWGRKSSGWWLRSYLWLHIVMGWVLSTLCVIGLTGLVRK